MVKLPLCGCRTATGKPGVFICSHPKVRAPYDLVTADVCQGCGHQQEKGCSGPLSPTDSEQVPPPLHRQVWSFTKSMANFFADGLKTLTVREYEHRLEICDTCDARSGNRCLQCGCNLSLKARGRAFTCPLGKWPDLSRKE